MEYIELLIDMFKHFSPLEWRVYIALHLFFMVVYIYYWIVNMNEKQEISVREEKRGFYEAETKSGSFLGKISMFLLIQLLSLISSLLLFDIMVMTVESLVR